MGINVTISVENLHKDYGAIKAVDGLTFHVNEGEVYSLLGPNGAGKTTTVEIIEGLRKPDSGKVTVLGLDPWHSKADIKYTVGIMPQDFRFVERITPEEAIRFYCSLFEVPDRSLDLLELVELVDVKDVYFQNLSGGQKQKLGICLALVNDPKVVFLDEPTTGLDPRARRRIWDLIRKLKEEGRTVILTTHYLEEAEMLSDRVGIVFKGKMLVEGTPKEIISRMGKGRKVVISTNPALLEYIVKDLGIECSTDEETISAHLTSNQQVIDILSFAIEKGIELPSLEVKEDTLEDIFVDLVGKEED